MNWKDAPEDANRISGEVVDAAIHLQSRLGPGLLEKTYRVLLADALLQRGLRVLQEVRLPVTLDGRTVEAGLRMDLLVDETVVVEVKAVSALARIHSAQLLTYLRLSGRPIGLLLNFNTFPLGIRRLVLDPVQFPPGSASSAVERRSAPR